MTLDEPDLARLRDQLDGSFGDGPPLLPPVDRLAPGRTALRRRRRAGAAGSAVVVAAVLAASVAVLGPGDDGPRSVDPVTPAPSLSTPDEGDIDEAQLEAELDALAQQAREKAERRRKARLVSNQFPASLDDVDGSLIVQDGWRVTQRVEEPVGYQPPEKSLGVVVTDGERTRWMLLSLTQVFDGNDNPIPGEVSPGASADDPGVGYSRYEDWLASMVAISGGPRDVLVTVTADDEVLAGPGCTLVDVKQIPVVEGYTSPGDRVARVRRDGRLWFVVVRGHGSGAETIPVDGDVLPESTLNALLAYLAQQTESGEGVR